MQSAAGAADAAVGPARGVHRVHALAVAGDFDTNGTLDLAVANSGSDNVSLLRGDGLGGFTEYDALGVAAPERSCPATGTATAGSIWRLARRAADASRSSSARRRYLASSTRPRRLWPAVRGRMTWSPATSTRRRPRPRGLRQVRARLRAAAAEHRRRLQPRTERPRRQGPTAIVAADFDRDGDVDLAVANDDEDNVMVLRNAAAASTPHRRSPAGGDSSPVSITAGDFDGDGALSIWPWPAGDNDRLHVYERGAIVRHAADAARRAQRSRAS